MTIYTLQDQSRGYEMSYLEKLKRLKEPMLDADITDKRPFVPFGSTEGDRISENSDPFVPFGSTYSDRISENSDPSIGSITNGKNRTYTR